MIWLFAVWIAFNALFFAWRVAAAYRHPQGRDCDLLIPIETIIDRGDLT